MAQSVITLLNFDSRTLRVSPPSKVPLAVWLEDRPVGGSFSLFVKYCEEMMQWMHIYYDDPQLLQLNTNSWTDW